MIFKWRIVAGICVVGGLGALVLMGEPDLQTIFYGTVFTLIGIGMLTLTPDKNI